MLYSIALAVWIFFVQGVSLLKENFPDLKIPKPLFFLITLPQGKSGHVFADTPVIRR